MNIALFNVTSQLFVYIQYDRKKKYIIILSIYANKLGYSMDSNAKQKKKKKQIKQKKTIALSDRNFSIVHICHKENL